MSGRLDGRRILVTGGASGIGLSCVERFAREGAQVTALDRDPGRLAELGRRLPDVGTVQADVSDPAAVTRVVDSAAAAMGGLDGLVNAAGIDLIASLEAMTPAEWGQLIAVNLTGPMLVCRAALPHLRAAGGGTIVNVSSGAGLLPLVDRTAYCTSKAGLQMFGKALALEAAPDGIRVNSVCPGAVETPLFREPIDGSPNAEARLEAIRQRYALKRIAEPHEISDVILWLTGGESSFVTGIAVAIDGGRSFH